MLVVTGLFCIFAPDWIICACGMSKLEDEKWLLWLVRGLGLLLLGIALFTIAPKPR
ncbi:MAG: hypothetical protein ACO1SX_26595 [Actinomycetota bacterium]